MSYLEGCTAPMRDENQLHAAVVEPIAHDDAEIKDSTIQNWYPGDAQGRGGIFNFVIILCDCRGTGCRQFCWTQSRRFLGPAVLVQAQRWILQPRRGARRVRLDAISRATSSGSIPLPHHQMNCAKACHAAASSPRPSLPASSRLTPQPSGNCLSTPRTRSRDYNRPSQQILHSFSVRGSIGNHCGALIRSAHTSRRRIAAWCSSTGETSKISEVILFYCRSVDFVADDATALVVHRFVKDVLQQMTMPVSG